MTQPTATPSGLHRQLLLSRKWAAISALTVVLMVAFAMLSRWQWQRAQEQIDADRAVLAQPAPAAELMVPGEQIPAAALGRIGTAEGSYVEQERLTGRLNAAGEPGDWIVGGLADGSQYLTVVVRGWVPAGAEPPPPAAAVEVAGRVHSDENFYSQPGATDVDTITSQAFAELWDRAVRPGYLVLATQDPAPGPLDPQPVPPVFGDTPRSGGLPIQNLGYAMQWLVFVGFAAFMWGRWFRDDLQEARAAAAASDSAAAAPTRSLEG